VNDLLRELAPRVLAAVVRHHGGFDECEDAVQEALLAASQQWPRDGMPDDPRAWLITVASRRRTEMWRSDSARRRREVADVEPGPVPDTDDTLTLLVLCCHPSLTRASQVALTLRAVGGLTTAEIARAYLVPEPTIAQRISRAKARIRGVGFEASPGAVGAVLQVLYLIFNEGYTASSGEALHRVELTAEAIRLTRLLRRVLPDDGEVAGLLALMLLTDARRPARTLPDGTLVPLEEQDRKRWDHSALAEGSELITATLADAPVGPYQLQAAIAAVHGEAGRAQDTDWAQILALYDLLFAMTPGPMVALNRIVAVAMVHGPEAGLRELPDLDDHYRVDAVRAHLLERSGDRTGAADSYRLAARRTSSLPERRYLEARASACL